MKPVAMKPVTAKPVTLDQWMKSEKLSNVKLSGELGCHRSRISLIRRRKSRASPELANAIVKRSRGKVSWESLMQLG